MMPIRGLLLPLLLLINGIRAFPGSLITPLRWKKPSDLATFGVLPYTTQLQAVDASLVIPGVVLTGVVVFGLFNIDNKMDLTDAGIAKMRKQWRDERAARGEIKPKEQRDKYAWFADLDDEVDLDSIGNKKGGGGCG